MKISRLQELEARMDEQLTQFGYTDEEQPAGVSPARALVRGAVGATAAAGTVAAYQNRAAIQTGAKDAARKGLKKTARAAGVASNKLHKTALKSSGMPMRAAGSASTILQKGATGLRKVAKSFSRADIDQVLHLAERIAKHELESELGNIIQFKDYGSQRDPEMIRAAGRQGNGFLGGRQALKSQGDFRDAGHVYRKRDALTDSAKGGVGGSLLTGGALAGGVLGSRKLIQATAAGKIPKGALRKGAVKASQVLKKAGRSKLVAVGGVGAALAGAQLAGNSIQNRSAKKRLAKRQSDAR